MAAERGEDRGRKKGSYAAMAAQYTSVLPQGAAAFVKELLQVSSALQRCVPEFTFLSVNGRLVVTSQWCKEKMYVVVWLHTGQWCALSAPLPGRRVCD